MHRLSVMLTVVCAVIGLARTGAAQGYQGGIRGAVHDAAGVVPGAEVTAINEETNVARSTMTNEAGEYNLPNLAPGLYGLKVAMSGFKAVTQRGVQVGTQQFLTLDVMLEVGELEETVNGHQRAGPGSRRSNASIGTVIDKTDMQTLPSPGRAAFLIGTTVPTVIPSGDTQFNRQQDQTNASLISLGGGTRRGNNYTLDGVPITDLRNRATANPTIESLEDVKVQVHTYDAEMGRTGGGVFNTTLRAGANEPARHRLLPDPPDLGPDQQLLQREGRPRQAGQPVLPRRRRRRRADRPQPHVLLVLDRELPRRPDPQRQRHDADGARTRAAISRRRPTPPAQLVIIYDPLTGQPFAGNRHPGQPHQPDGRGDAAVPAAAPTSSARTASTNYTRTSLIKNQFQQLYTAKVVAQAQRHEHRSAASISTTGPTSPTPTTSARADQTEPTRFADPIDYILVRRPQILALNNTWVMSDSSVLALRFGMTRFPDNNTLSMPLRPGDARLLADLSRSDHAREVPRRAHPRLRPVRRADARRDQPDRDQLEVDERQRQLLEVRRHATLFKVGGDFRKIGVDSYIPGDGAGFFDFDKDMTSSNGGTGSTTDGNAFASFLLGYPVDGAHQPDLGVDAARTSTPTTTAATCRTTGGSTRS